MTINRPVSVVEHLLVEHNSHIEIEFQLVLLDGTIVESTQKGETLHFTLGDGTFLPKLEEMLIGLEQGTTAKFTLLPEQAFGLSDPNNIHTMVRQEFPEELALQEGFVIGFETPTGEEVLGTVQKISEHSVLVDFNHPLADKTIIFTATIKALTPRRLSEN
ncbi:hypothetical protein MNBD_GAMMA03-364 [hydrothermal vent metagenome]|uniref:peptidylprolyl isomerase n=1 Tax=hydrothermal vent metagenome TaxID=652676 RepID=A0A3B0W6K7_9ZZZZ